jgi:hypothetical protein
MGAAAAGLGGSTLLGSGGCFREDEEIKGRVMDARSRVLNPAAMAAA